MRAFERWFVGANKLLIAALLAAIFLITFINVVLRYAFGSSLAWGEEVARFLMVAGAFVGSGLALRQGRLVAINLIQDLLPRPLRSLVRWAIVATMLVFMGLVAWYGAEFAAFGWDKETMATQVSRGIPYLAIPIGAAFFVLHLLFFAQRFVSEEFEVDTDSDETLHSADQ